MSKHQSDSIDHTRRKKMRGEESDVPVLLRQRWPESRQKTARYGQQRIEPTPSLKEFCRRLLRFKPISFMSSPNPIKIYRRSRQSRDTDDEKSHSSSGLSSEGSLDSSQPNLSPDKHQRIATYLAIETTRPITSFLSEDTNLSFRGSPVGNSDDADTERNWGDDSFRDDVRLLQEPVLFKSHLTFSCENSRQLVEEEDRVALLSEHDDLVEMRKGGYDIDIVDSVSINSPMAMQTLPLLALVQDLASQEDEMIQCLMSQFMSWSQKDPVSSTGTAKKAECNTGKSSFQSTDIQIGESGTGEQADIAITSNPQQVPEHYISQQPQHQQHSGQPETEPQTTEDTTTSTFDSSLNPLGEETPAFSEVIRDRTERQKALYLSRLRETEKKKKSPSIPRPAVHGVLFPLTELSSDDESSRYSGNMASPVRVSRSASGEQNARWSSGRGGSHIIPEEEEKLLCASF